MEHVSARSTFDFHFLFIVQFIAILRSINKRLNTSNFREHRMLADPIFTRARVNEMENTMRNDIKSVLCTFAQRKQNCRVEKEISFQKKSLE